MEKIIFENAEVVTPAKVTVGGTAYNVTPAVYTEVDKYLSAETLAELQDNTENEIDRLENEIDRLDENCGTGTDDYSASSTYALNDIVIYQNRIYRCTTAIAAGESFNSSKWVQTSLKALSIPTKTVDANGWTVWDYGNRKEWTKKGSLIKTIDGSSWAPCGDVNLPNGMTTLSNNILSSSLISTDSAISLNAGASTSSSVITIQGTNRYTGSIAFTVFYQFRIVQN